MNTVLPPTGRLAGVDYGTVRIGIAVTDPDRRFASPYENYPRRDPKADAQRFQRLVRDERIVGFVLGLPVHASGDESAKSSESRRFARWLGDVTGLPVAFVDERFTTVFADELLGQAKMTSKRRKERRDMLAAQILLTAYLESAGRASSPQPLEDGPQHDGRPSE